MNQEEPIMAYKVGDLVYYVRDNETDSSKFENGVIKKVRPDGDKAWVVYNCGGEWYSYQDYTGALTHYSNLRKGWIIQ